MCGLWDGIRPQQNKETVSKVEEWQKAMILQAERQKVTNHYLRKINGSLSQLATKEDLNDVCSEAVKGATGIKDRLLWVMTIALIVIAGGATALKYAA